MKTGSCRDKIVATPGDKGKLYRSVISDTEKVLIQRALATSHGNQILASRMLGVHRNTIRNKIRQLHIDVHLFKKI